MRNLSLAFAVLAALASSPARPQSVLRMVPLGFCSLSGMSSATALSACSGGIPAGADYAVICAYTQAVNYRDDGVAPTGTVGTGGQGIAAGNCIGYTSTLANLQFIQETGGAVLGVSFYRGAPP